MGREVKRVALDFDWPLNKPWKGFLNPHYDGHCKNCAVCRGSGLSPEAKVLQDQWYGNAAFWPEMTGSVPFTEKHPIIRARAEHAIKRSPEYFGTREEDIVREAARLAELFNQSWSHHLDADDVDALVKADRLLDFRNRPTPTTAEVNEWSISGGMGHDAINSWIVVKAKCKRLRLSYQCKACQGQGSVWDSPLSKQTAENWERQEPSAGEGWQVWETVSEGSPITPVFATADGLIQHLAVHGDLWDQKRGDGGWGIDRAKAFVEAGWVPSLLTQGNRVLDSKDIALELSHAKD